MGKDIIVTKPVFRAYFGKCFDNIALGDRLYGLKQQTETKDKQVLHTYVKTTTQIDPETNQRKSVNQVVGYYDTEKEEVKTGTLSYAQKTLLKQQFLQLAYDAASQHPTHNKLYNDLTFDPNQPNAAPIELYYKVGQKQDAYNIEADYNRDAREYWEKIRNTPDRNISQQFRVQQNQSPDIYTENGKKVRDDSADFRILPPLTEYKTNLSKNLLLNWSTIKRTLDSDDTIFNVDEYFNALYEAVLENMEPEDRKLIERELPPNFGVTEKEKALFLTRNPHVKEHFDVLDPTIVGNKFVAKSYPDAETYIPATSDMLRKYFPDTIGAKIGGREEIPEDLKKTYNRELTNFVSDLLNPPVSTDYDAMNLHRVANLFGINKRSIRTQDDINECIQKIGDRVMPALILSQREDVRLNPQGVVTSVALNRLVCDPPETSKDLKFVVASSANAYRASVERNKAIYDEFIAPNIKEDGTLDLKKMQDTWLALAEKADEPVKDTDSEALKAVKGTKDSFKNVTEFNGERKEPRENFASLETRTEWRNEAVMGLLQESISYFGTSKIISQVNEEKFRFGMDSADYTKRMYGKWKDSQVAEESLRRLRVLGQRPQIAAEENMYGVLPKNDNGFPVIPPNSDYYDKTRTDYLGRCCNEIKLLQDSYNKRSFFYHIAFWRRKPEKEAIRQIKASLLASGVTDKQIKDTLATVKTPVLTDGAFNYKVNHDPVFKMIVKEGTEKDNFEAEKLEDELIGPEVEASDMELEENKKLTQYVLPKNNVKVIDPVLGNVSEQYGAIVNLDKTEPMNGFALEQYAKEQQEKQAKNPAPEKKVYTEKDVEIWEEPENQNGPIDPYFLELNEEMERAEREFDEKVANGDSFDEDEPEQEEQKELSDEEKFKNDISEALKQNEPAANNIPVNGEKVPEMDPLSANK